MKKSNSRKDKKKANAGQKLAPLSPTELRQSLPPNPLDVFPSKKDTISGAFFGIDTKKHKRKLEGSDRWLYPDKVDPHFGLMGSTQKDDIRRAFRRIESSHLFAPVKAKDAPLSDIIPSTNPSNNFIVVEESRLKELIKLEKTLRKEKEMLGEQCGWALPDFQLNARVPVPATRMAVHSFCEKQMQKVAADILKLKEDWFKFCHQNHYDRPHLYLQESYLKCAPLSQRALKLRLVREAVDTWRIRKDRDTMLFEDDLSYLIGKHHEAALRQKDYERYYILASRYGSFNEEDFNRDPRPGRRYFIAATTGAVKLQMLWDRYWATMKLRRYRAARRIQTIIRMHQAYKKNNVIIRLRLKIGKKTYYYFCWHSWLRYNQICRMIKDALHFQFHTFISSYFTAWRDLIQNARTIREERARKVILRSKNTGVYSRFLRWTQFVNAQKQLKIRLRRLFGFPFFDFWLDYVKQIKYYNRIHRAAARLQSLCRMINKRFLFHRKRRAQMKLTTFNFMVINIRKVREKRRERILTEFEAWAPEETSRRTQRLNEIERQRVVKRTQFVQEKEKGALNGLRKHLSSSDGKQQIEEMLKNSDVLTRMMTKLPSKEADKKYSSLSKVEKATFIRKKLLAECSRVIRLLEAHNYNVKHPTFLVCPDVRCGACFTTEAQYHSHMVESAPHHGAPPQFSEFHMMLRHQRALELIRTYLTRLHGMGGTVNYLDAWYAIQEWKKFPTNGENFEARAMGLAELYIFDDSPRKLDLSSIPASKEMMEMLESVKMREHPGLYRLTKGRPGLIRGFLGVPPADYYEFATDDVLTPDVFDELEWACFLRVFNALEQEDRERWRASEEFNTYSKMREEETAHRRDEFIKDYEKFRLMKMDQWARSYIGIERRMFNKASEIVEIFMQREIDRLYKMWEKRLVHERVAEIRHEEQEIHESTALVRDEASFWVEEDMLDSLFTHYTSALIDKMLQIEDCRRGLLQYAGYIKATSRHMHIDPNAKSGKEGWFTDMFKEAQEAEDGAITSHTHVHAVIIIQKRMRGVLARRRVRKLFMSTYEKHIDPDSGYPYYLNVITGESSWERPLMTHHLYHYSNW